MYELEIPNQPRDRVQPRIILLQIQMESLDHYFLHWNWPGPAVMCQVIYYASYSYKQSFCGMKFLQIL